MCKSFFESEWSEVVFLLLIKISVHTGEQILDSTLAILNFLEDSGILGYITFEALDA